MVVNETAIENYLKSCPNASLKEFSDHVKYIKEEKEKLELESVKKHEELIRNFENKCFRIVFNSNSISYFKIDKNILNLSPIKLDVYSVYISATKFSVSLEKNSVINLRWLPGQEEWFGSPIVEAEVIPEDCFEKIVNKYDTLFNMAKSIKDEYNCL